MGTPWNTQDVLMFTNGLCIVIEEDPRTKRSLTSGLQSVDKGGLPGFGDASQRVYGSAAFFCDDHEDGSIVINLVMSGTGKVTLSRLEFVAAY